MPDGQVPVIAVTLLILISHDKLAHDEPVVKHMTAKVVLFF